MKLFNLIVSFIFLTTLPRANAQAPLHHYHPQVFVHPGISQNRADLDLMKKRILSGTGPWKSAFDRLSKAPADFQPKPFAHVIRGSYGHPAIGGAELTASANEAYSQAIQWYVTGEKKHAEKAIEIINAWSARLWDFDDNDAKLLAGWTGHVFCNAAEILRYSNSGWQQKDIVQFKNMMLTAYYPLIKDFFPEANGNWDAAIMDTQLAIAVFCDDHTMFDKVIDHYLFGEGNSGITKYIYPRGQCEESTRDQGHTQLGLGELAQTCKIAWTQGVDLYSAAGNRLAVGYEYTGKFMSGKDVAAYGTISQNVRGRYSDIYESVYQHYHDVKGMDMPYTRKAADTSRSKSAIMLLTAVRASLINQSKFKANSLLKPRDVSAETGAQLTATANQPNKSYRVSAAGAIQVALDSCAKTGGWVILDKGLFTLPAPLRIPGGVTLAGQGKETILFLDPKLNPGKIGSAMVNAADDLHDVILRDFVIEGGITPKTGTDPNQDRRQRSYQSAQSRAGILFLAQYDGQMKNIRLEHITVRNCTKNGVAIVGAAQVSVLSCDLSDNGSSVVPGPGIHHNLLISHVQGCKITDSRMDTSPWGNGVQVVHSSDVVITGNELARNHLNGIYVTDSHKVTVSNNLTEGNDDNGILFNTQAIGCSNVNIKHNISQYNGKQAISAAQIKNIVLSDNTVGNNRR